MSDEVYNQTRPVINSFQVNSLESTRNSKKRKLILTFVFVLLAAFFLISMLYYHVVSTQNKFDAKEEDFLQQDQQDQNYPSPSVSEPTIYWNIFRGEVFALNYPTYWRFDYEDSSWIFRSDKDGNKIALLKVISNPNTDDLLETLSTEANNVGVPVSYSDVKDISVSEEIGPYSTILFDPQEENYPSFIIFKDEKSRSAALFVNYAKGNSDGEILKKVIASFRFLAPSDRNS
jgi:preprotein translocase subunit SecG